MGDTVGVLTQGKLDHLLSKLDSLSTQLLCYVLKVSKKGPQLSRPDPGLGPQHKEA